MSEADKMFAELGYRRVDTEQCKNIYRNRFGSHIYFDNKNKSIDLAGRQNKNKILTLKQLRAINKKCKELGWLDE
mgnify:CR=1 FL=1